MSRYQKGTTNLDFTEARDSERQWHQLGHMQVCISLQTDNHHPDNASTPPLSFLQANQQRQSTEGINIIYCVLYFNVLFYLRFIVQSMLQKSKMFAFGRTGLI